jgi:hypothetical protein
MPIQRTRREPKRVREKRASGRAFHAETFALSALVFAQQLAEARVVADRVKVAVLAHEAKVAITELHGLAERLQGLVGSLQKGEAAREIVMRQSVVGSKLDKFAIDLKTLGITTLLGEGIPHRAQYIHVVWLASKDVGVEIKFEIQLALIHQPWHGNAG